MSDQAPSENEQMQDFNSQETESTSQRYVTQELAQLEVYGRQGKVFCKMANLSSSGAFFEIINSNYMPRAGDLVRITVLLRQINKTHVLDAEIIWCKGLGLGLNFIKKHELIRKLSGRPAII
ncbi:MAG: PilZ domain-containing protein [Bdellovibrionaceae bacterium]|nr:PilZ domain-containing protein [Bdellovibrio sp.]